GPPGVEEVLDAPPDRFAVRTAGGDQGEHGPGGLGSGRRALALEVRVVVALTALAPPAAGVLDRFQPVGGLYQSRVRHRVVERLQALKDLPGTVDVIHSPAAVPAAFRLLSPPQVSQRSGRRRVIGAVSERSQELENSRRDVGAARVE